MSRAENIKAIQEFFDDIYSIVSAFLQAIGEVSNTEIDPKIGDILSKVIKNNSCEKLGGMRVTLPTLKDIYREERDQKIRNLFNGANHQELAIIFDLTVGRIRRIVNMNSKKDQRKKLEEDNL